MARQFGTVGVVGLGTMGAGIVEVFARNGIDVIATEIDEGALARGRSTLTASVDRAVARGKLAGADRDALLARVRFAVGLDSLRDADLVVEAVPERLDLKRQLFAELDRVCRPDAILATNTSSLSVTEVSVATRRPDQVIGMHFFNPAPVMRLVEVVRTVVTAADVVADIEALCARLGKVGVTIEDRAGFIANWLLFGYLNHAAALFESRYASREDLDAAMKLGGGLPMGPLALMDLIGLDTSYEILDTMYRRGGRDRRHAPAPVLKQLVTAGLLGRKTGRGFYTYEKPGSPVVVEDALTPRPGSTTDRARPVTTVGVVGSGTMAAGIVEVFARQGYAVVSVSRGEEDSDQSGSARLSPRDDPDQSSDQLGSARLSPRDDPDQSSDQLGSARLSPRDDPDQSSDQLGSARLSPRDDPDQSSAALRETVRASLTGDVSSGKITEADRDAALERVTWSASLDELAGADLVVEAVVEDLAAKKALFASLDEVCKPGVLFATATSSLPVIEIAMATGRPADVLGLHFFHPAPARALVEVVRTIRTSPEAVATATAVLAAAGKTPVVCGDRAGFVVNNLLFPYLNDAVRMLEAGYATVDDIDAAMKLGCGYPVGPFEFLDAVGLDVALAIQRALYHESREPGLAPAPLLDHLVTAGYLGRATGRGFRHHD